MVIYEMYDSVRALLGVKRVLGLEDGSSYDFSLIFFTILSVVLILGVSWAFLRRQLCVEFLRKVLGINIYSQVVGLFSSSVLPDTRHVIRRVVPQNQATRVGHSHAREAGIRSIGEDIIEKASLVLGKPTYSISGNKTEAIIGNCSRLYYTAKDFQSEIRPARSIRSDELLKMVDVDYYVDMPSMLTGNDCILYTWCPKKPAGTYERSAYATTGNIVRMTVNGGAIYEHELWDYDSDHFIVDHWWGSAFYLVEYRDLGDDHRIVYLNCLRVIYGPFAWIISGRRLYRRQFDRGGYAYSQYMHQDTSKGLRVMHSFALFGSTSSADVDDQTFVSIRLRHLVSKDPKMSDIERILRANNHEDALMASAVMYFVLSTGGYHYFPLTARQDTHTYQTLAPLVTEDAKPSMHQIIVNDVPFKALSGSGFAPGRSLNNDTSCVEGRINDPRNPGLPLPVRYYRYLKEFVDQVVPPHIRGSLVPDDYETMSARLKRPNQQSKLRMVSETLYCTWLTIKAFQKAEAYPKICPPRNIATVPMDFNFRLGQYAYAFSAACLKTAHWYAFGKHPTETTNQLTTKAEAALRYGNGSVVDTDGSAWDFSQHPIMMELDQRLFLTAFGKEHHAEYLALMDRVALAKGTTKEGVQYTNGSATITGSSTTSLRNSCANAFTHYIVLRESGLNEALAYERLGLYGGDDGVTFNVAVPVIEDVWSRLGMLVKCSVIYPGSAVPFLGRLYPDPWSHGGSIADVQRQLRKFHLTTCPPTVPGALVLRRKAEAFLITDPDTPLLSDLCRKILTLSRDATPREQQRYAKFLDSDVPYWSRYEAPFSTVDNDVAFPLVAKGMEICTTDLTNLIHKVNTTTCLKQLCNIGVQFCPDPDVQVPAVVAGQVLRPLVEVPTFKRKQLELREKVASKPGARVCRYSERGVACPRPHCDFHHVAVKSTRVPGKVAKANGTPKIK